MPGGWRSGLGLAFTTTMPTSSADVALLARRAGFGATQTQIDQWTVLDRAVLIDQLLNTSAPYSGPAPPVMGDASGLSEWAQFIALGQWWINRMAASTTPIVEKMTLCWHGLFTTSFSKVFDPPMIAAQHAFYRANALGNLKTLVHGMSLQPAMLDYLDNASSGKWAPNQNYARELMELFLLGAGNYSEADVEAGAAAWTGHSIERTTGAYLFRSSWHDPSIKTFLGQTGALDGPDTVEIMLTNATVAPIMARWIATKLWEFFAHPSPPTAAVNAIATKLLENYNITEALRVLFNRNEFYLPASVEGHVRSPLEYMIAILKGMPTVTAEELHPEWFLDDMGQIPFDPPTVEGWKYNGYWVSTAAAGAKANFAQYATWRLAGLSKHPFAAITSLTVNDAVQLALDTFHIVDPTPQTEAVLRNWLTSQRVANQPWFEANGMLILVLLCPELQIG